MRAGATIAMMEQGSPGAFDAPPGAYDVPTADAGGGGRLGLGTGPAARKALYLWLGATAWLFFTWRAVKGY